MVDIVLNDIPVNSKTCQRTLAQVVERSRGTPGGLSSIPRLSALLAIWGEFQGFRVKKNPLAGPTPKYRPVAVPSHGDAVPLYMDEAGVRGFS
jgi:hypothetical protein